MKTRIFGIFLLIVLIVPVALTYLWLETEREQIREEVQMELRHLSSEATLVQIKIHKKDKNSLQWKDRREFMYHSEMYDVVRKEKRGEFTIYYCYKDHRETVLEAKWRSIQKKLYGSDKKSPQGEIQLVYLLDHLNMPQTFSYVLTIEEPSATQFTHLVEHHSVYLDADSPPPRLL